MTLGYLVFDANWSPRYDVRGDLESGGLTMEYGANISQRTGEDWKDVTLVLSTARPSMASNPPSMDPVFVDVYARLLRLQAEVVAWPRWRRMGWRTTT